MYVMSLTCDFGAFDEYMVVSLKIWTLSALENASKFYFAVEYLECVSGGEEKFIDVVILCFELLVWWEAIFCWHILSEGRNNGIPEFLNLDKGVAL